MANQASTYLATGESPTQMGNRHPSIAPYETLLAGNGSLAVTCGNDGQFRKLAEVLGIAEVAQDARFATNAARVHNRAELVTLPEARLATGSVTDWVARLTAVVVPAGAIGSIADAFALAERLGLEPTVNVGPASAPQVRNPISFSATTITRYSAPPRLGSWPRLDLN